MSAEELIAFLFAVLLAALVVALILRRDFRDAVLGGRGEANVLGVITVKGVAIVLLCGVLVGGILMLLGNLPNPPPKPNKKPGDTATSTRLPVRQPENPKKAEDPEDIFSVVKSGTADLPNCSTRIRI